MPVLPDSPKCAAVRADMKGDGLTVDSSIFMRINWLKLIGLYKKNRLSFKINVII